MNYTYSCDDKGKNEVKCKESGESSVVYGEAPSNSLNQIRSNVRGG